MEDDQQKQPQTPQAQTAGTADSDAKWTEIEHLPEWDEEFYDVYTAKKFGKWVMLKTLKKELRDDPKYQRILKKEFDVRYNLSHPNIIMINDLEDVPGVGLSIITDDVYGNSLAKLLKENAVTPFVKEQVLTRLVDAIQYIQTNHIVHRPIRPETIIFTENVGNLKLIDVGFDQHEHLTPAAASEDISSYGEVLRQVLDATDDHDPRLRRVVRRCLTNTRRHRFRDIPDLKMALAGDSNSRLYLIIIVFLALMTVILGFLVWAQPVL